MTPDTALIARLTRAFMELPDDEQAKALLECTRGILILMCSQMVGMLDAAIAEDMKRRRITADEWWAGFSAAATEYDLRQNRHDN